MLCVATLHATGKLTTPNISFKELIRLADYVLVEADGSRHLPLKYPNETEFENFLNDNDGNYEYLYFDLNINKPELTRHYSKNPFIIKNSSSIFFKSRELSKNNMSRSIGNVGENMEGHEREYILKMNENLKSILQKQSDKSYLNKFKLPDIRKVRESKNLIRHIRDSSNKELGENYDPEAFNFNDKHAKGRNYVGGKFEY